MLDLQRLRADHYSAVLCFELENRAYFAQSISDRGDEFFEHFSERYEALLAEQQAGTGAYHVLVEEDGGSVLGRFNLMAIDGDGAVLGYRVAERAAGRGMATRAVGQLCDLAGRKYGLRRIVASTSRQNVASQRVLVKAGFSLVGPADPADVGGKQGYRYERLLTQE